MKTSMWVVLAVLALAAASSGPAVADGTDFESVDAIITAYYDVLSGPAGERIDWNRFKALFLPEGRIFGDRRGGTEPTAWTFDEYEQVFDRLLSSSNFWEYEVSRKVESFRGIANVFSTYAGRFTLDSRRPALHGIVSMQLVHKEGRWWIASLVFQAETTDEPVPPEYLE